ncbi:caspase family protein [Streptomyces sp. CA-210063]|uniref:caspase, EACC1-associated type n=1 Tax=Streptomyces sp. CA-210063 TaxID=2801029 RepID=UPI00214C7AE6|nr:caspase family protein [Streptomyces sp. CA-210063]UUU36593.1 caspase family protein [Streptomyces sp. CA-210063]
MNRFPDPARSKAVLIGTSRYAHTSLHELPAVRANLTELRAVLTHPVSGTLRAEHCTVVDDPAVPDDVGTPLARAARDATDVLLVYYAGHGLIDDGGGLQLALSRTDPDRLKWTALAFGVLREEMANSSAAVRVLVLDCCFSGRALAAMSDGRGVITGHIEITGTYTLTSTSATTTSHAPPGATHTVFTEALLTALREPDPLTLDDMFRAVHQRLRSQERPLPQRLAGGTAGELTLTKGPPPEALEPTAVATSRPSPLSRRRLLAGGSATAALALGSTYWAVRDRFDHAASGSGSPAGDGTPTGEHSRSASGSSGGEVTGATEVGRPLSGHDDTVHAVAFQPGGHMLASGSADRTIRLWNVTDPAKPKPVGTPLTTATDDIACLAFSPDGSLLAAGGHDNKIRLWKVTDPARPTPLGDPLTGHSDAVFSVAFNSDGSLLVSGSADRTLRLWNVTDPAKPTLIGRAGAGHSDALTSVAFGPETLMASGSADESIWLWNAADPPSTVGKRLTGHGHRVYSVAFSPDGGFLASGGGDRTVRLWDVSDPAAPKPAGQPLTTTEAVYSVAFAPGGKLLAGGCADGKVHLWNMAAPAEPVPLGTLLTAPDTVYSIAFATAGELLAAGGTDRTIRLWEVTRPDSP